MDVRVIEICSEFVIKVIFLEINSTVRNIIIYLLHNSAKFQSINFIIDEYVDYHISNNNLYVSK